MGRARMITRVIARTKVNARLYLGADGRLVTANRKAEAASYATIAEAEDAIRKHVHPAHWDRWEVWSDWREDV